MKYLFTDKVSRRGKKIISRPMRAVDLDFVEFYDEFSRNWKQRARALRERRLSALKHI